MLADLMIVVFINELLKECAYIRISKYVTNAFYVHFMYIVLCMFYFAQ